MILSLSLVTILASLPSLPPSREAISLVCEAVPGTKGALRKRKVHGWRETEGGMDGGGRDKKKMQAIATMRELRK